MASWKRIYTEKEKDTIVTNNSSNLATTSAINTALNNKSNSIHTHTSDDVEQTNTSGFNIQLYETTSYTSHMTDKNNFQIPAHGYLALNFNNLLKHNQDYVLFKITGTNGGSSAYVYDEDNDELCTLNSSCLIKILKTNGGYDVLVYDSGDIPTSYEEVQTSSIYIVNDSNNIVTGYFSNERYVYKGVFVDLIYPIGSIYFTLNDDDPNLTFIGTEWERVEDKFLLASDSTYTNDSTGGSADAVNVSHTHIQNAHTHTQNGHTHAVPSARYVTLIGSSGPNWGYHGATGMKYSSGNYYYIYSNANGNGIGEGGPNIGNATAVNQNTIAENNPAGDGDGIGKNMPPFVIVNCWERVK